MWSTCGVHPHVRALIQALFKGACAGSFSLENITNERSIILIIIMQRMLEIFLTS